MESKFIRALGFAVVLVLGGFFATVVSAQGSSITYDPYADRVSAVGTTGTTTNRDRAVGAPDSRSATISGNNNFITLDMGSGEEGTDSLRLHMGAQVAPTQVRVTFFDRDMQEINSQAGSVVVALGASTQDFPFRFADFGKAYRYVRIASMRDGSFALDAVTASGYIGATATQDTDGDGIADRTENSNGTDPQVVNQNPPPPPPPTDTTGPVITNVNAAQVDPSSEQIFWSTNEGATSQVEYGTNSPTTRTPIDTRLSTTHTVLISGLTPSTWYTFRVISRDQAGNETVSGISYFMTQAPPPPASRDKDADRMDDQWETQYGLNPASAADASGDLDSDGVSNLDEYRMGSNPTKSDSDADGMPDGWEKDNNLLVTRDDAAADPDADGTSNLTEYQNGTDPHRSDAPTATTTPTDTKSSTWMWWVLGALILILLIAGFTRGRNQTTIINT